jgi:tRNA modification GTPase
MLNYLENSDTILALATGNGNAALAIIRISGKQAIECVAECVLQKDRFLKIKAKEISLYQIVDKKENKRIDEVTAIKYESPASYTGENMVEIICHGGEVIVEEILSVLIKTNIRFAKRGEFTRRAYLNNKMDLMKAESINQIIEATNQKQINSAREMYYGHSKDELFRWKEIIKKILIELEAIIEFPEEDDIKEKKNTYLYNMEKLDTIIEEEIQKRELVKQNSKGLIVPIVGIANAGKSTLFNLILGFDRVIVHHEEGTTRDAVSEEIIINGEKIKIIDTAGLNDTENQIELLGMKKTWEFVENADSIIWVTPSDKEITEKENRLLKEVKKEKISAIISKSDLNSGNEKKKTLKNNGISFLDTCFIRRSDRKKTVDFIGESIKKNRAFSNDEPAIICTKRQEEIITRIKKKLSPLMINGKTIGEEVLSHEFKGILNDLEEFVGETSNEELLSSIFSEFCIGK